MGRPEGRDRAQREGDVSGLDGEIVCLDRDGRSNFYNLMFRRDWPSFYGFDVLSIDGEDLRDHTLIERKRRLRAIMPRIASCSTMICRAVAPHCSAKHAVVIEGIVGKWADGRHATDGVSTSWVKIKNPE
jgi:bifunctional non-homologous end joining protein LigD